MTPDQCAGRAHQERLPSFDISCYAHHWNYGVNTPNSRLDNRRCLRNGGRAAAVAFGQRFDEAIALGCWCSLWQTRPEFAHPARQSG